MENIQFKATPGTDMTIHSRSTIEKLVDREFANLVATRGEVCTNPIHSGHFVFGFDPITIQKKEAVRALRLREWFAANNPSVTLPLPIAYDEIEDYRRSRGMWGIIGFYARSLFSWRYDVNLHPSLSDYACGLMATDTGFWGIEHDPFLKKKFPPRALPGLDGGGRCTFSAHQSNRWAA
jgi:hypothetical protein